MIRRFASFACVSWLVGVTASAQTVAIVHAKAWTLTASMPVENATVVIKDGKIDSVTSGDGPPSGAHVIDAKGRPVTPGLIHPATHLGLLEVSAATDTVDTATKSSSLGADFDIQYALNANSALIQLARADGLTRAISYPTHSGVPPFSGTGALLRLNDSGDVLESSGAGVFVSIGNHRSEADGSRAAQWELLRHALDAAKVALASPNGAPASQAGTSAAAVNSSASQVGNAAASMGSSAAQGVTPVAQASASAAQGGIPAAPAGTSAAPSGAATASPSTRSPQVLALAPVLAGKVPLAISTNRESDIRQAIRLASDYSLRVIIIGGTDAWRVAKALAAAKIAMIVDPQGNLPGNFDELGSRLDNVTLLHKAGVTVATAVLSGIHQSYNAGESLREGAGLAVANGLPYIDALRSITVVPAEIWGIAGRCGTIAPGKDGDLVVWDGDPLEPTSAPVTVLVAGKEVSLVTRQTRLRDRYLPKAGLTPSARREP